MNNIYHWEKIGLIFRPNKDVWWMQSHASLPTPLFIKEDVFRIFFASRNQENHSHVGYFDFDIVKQKVLYVCNEPVLLPGPLGHFDDSGVYPASIIHSNNEIYLYTIGWNSSAKNPVFYSSIGIAISKDNGNTFKKYKNISIMGRSEYDPCLVTSPFVIKEKNIWKMWYVSGFKWEIVNGVPESYYHIKYASSMDGLDWERKGHICIDHQKKNEKNIARSCIIAVNTGYQAWYSYNCGKGYRIGYAESHDGYLWNRRDDLAGIELSNEGFDSMAMAYPFVVHHKNKTYMFYNGNRFGYDGIALAIQKEKS